MARRRTRVASSPASGCARSSSASTASSASRSSPSPTCRHIRWCSRICTRSGATASWSRTGPSTCARLASSACGPCTSPTAARPCPAPTCRSARCSSSSGRWACYRAAGVNRLSLGAQSFHAGHLRTLGRDHGAADVRAAAAAARATGFANLSLDLIFAVPGETLAEWEGDLEAALALGPEHVSAYTLTYEPGTPFHAWRASGRLRAVDEDGEAAMAEAALERLAAAGYARYEVSSFARPGFASRHNTSYWDGSDYLGLGPGAHSFSAEPAPGRRW